MNLFIFIVLREVDMFIVFLYTYNGFVQLVVWEYYVEYICVYSEWDNFIIIFIINFIGLCLYNFIIQNFCKDFFLLMYYIRLEMYFFCFVLKFFIIIKYIVYNNKSLKFIVYDVNN